MLLEDCFLLLKVRQLALLLQGCQQMRGLLRLGSRRKRQGNLVFSILLLQIVQWRTHL